MSFTLLADASRHRCFRISVNYGGQHASGIFGSIGLWLPSNWAMKPIATVGVVAAALGCLFVLAAAQGSLHWGSSPGSSMPWPGNAQSNVIVVPIPASNLLLPALVLTPTSASKIHSLPLLDRAHPRAVSASPPAGVYKTVPYSCIVVVPGPHPDDRCVVNLNGVESAMPIIRPDLRFIPWNPAKQ